MLKTSNEQFKIEEVKQFTMKLVTELTNIEKKAFGLGGLHNEWLMVPMLRYGKVFIGKVDEEVIGCAQFIRTWSVTDCAYLYGISLLPQKRGKGLGTQFLKESLNSLKNDGIKKVILSVSPDNKRAISVYEAKLGFKKVELKHNEYGNGEDRYIMECRL